MENALDQWPHSASSRSSRAQMEWNVPIQRTPAAGPASRGTPRPPPPPPPGPPLPRPLPPDARCRRSGTSPGLAVVSLELRAEREVRLARAGLPQVGRPRPVEPEDEECER